MKRRHETMPTPFDAYLAEVEAALEQTIRLMGEIDALIPKWPVT